MALAGDPVPTTPAVLTSVPGLALPWRIWGVPRQGKHPPRGRWTRAQWLEGWVMAGAGALGCSLSLRENSAKA